MTRDRSVLIVLESLGATGGHQWAYALAERWAATGWRVGILPLLGTQAEAVAKMPRGVNIYEGEPWGVPFVRAIPRSWTKWHRIARQFAVLLIPTSVGMSLPVGYSLARAARVPYVVYSQGIADESLRLWERRRMVRGLYRRCLIHADRVICISPRSLEGAMRVGVRSERLSESRTGIAVEAISRRQGESRSGNCAGTDSDQRQPLIVASGVLEEHKRWDVLIHAISLLAKRDIDARVVHMGLDGGARDELQGLVRTLGIEDRMTFVGFVQDPLTLVAQADVFVHPARYETVGLVLLEALALGVPVIAADSPYGGPRLVLRDGEFGRLFEEGSAGQLATALAEHFSHPRDLRERAASAKEHLLRNYDADRLAAAMSEQLAVVAGL